MTSTSTAKLVVVVAVIFGGLAVLGTLLNEPEIVAPLWISHLWRTVVMTEIGIYLGLLTACMAPIYRLKIDPQDQILRPLGILALSCAILSIFAFCQMIERWSLPLVSWRIPLSLVAFLIGDISLILIVKRLRHVVRRAITLGSIVRFTIMDISRPGPDNDLIREVHANGL